MARAAPGITNWLFAEDLKTFVSTQLAVEAGKKLCNCLHAVNELKTNNGIKTPMLE